MREKCGGQDRLNIQGVGSEYHVSVYCMYIIHTAHTSSNTK